MKKKVIIVLSDSGNIGKTFVASVILEALRQVTKADAYVCDRQHQALYERYGQRIKGKLIAIEEQNPTDGVSFLDIRDTNQIDRIASSLNTDSEYILFDFPADSTGELGKCMGSPNDLLEFFDYNDSQLILTPVIADAKSFKSVDNLKAEFGIGAEFIIAINEGLMIARNETALLAKAKKDFTEEKHFFLKQNLSQRVFDSIKQNSLRQAYTPRAERKQPDGSFYPGDDSFIIKDRGDQFKMDRFLVDTTAAVNALFQ